MCLVIIPFNGLLLVKVMLGHQGSELLLQVVVDLHQLLFIGTHFIHTTLVLLHRGYS